jgi:uncharacterized protein
MLRVMASKGKSQIDGWGLFAREFIPKGALVWEAVPGFDLFLAPAEFAALSEINQRFFMRYSFLDPAAHLYIASMDDDRFTNDSIAPNTGYDPLHCLTRALKDIPKGEEITVDYGELEGEPPPWRARTCPSEALREPPPVGQSQPACSLQA